MHDAIGQLKKCLWYLEQPTIIWKIKRNTLSLYDLTAFSYPGIKQFYTEYPHLHQLNRPNITDDIHPQLLTAVACHREPKEPVAIQFQTVIS